MGLDNLAATSKSDEGRNYIFERLTSVNVNRNVSRILTYDKTKESISFISQSISGIKDVISEIKQIFISVSDYPYNQIFEEISGSQLGSGTAIQLIERMLWLEKIIDWINQNWLKHYTKLFKLIYGDSVKVEIPFKIGLTALEKAELENIGADRIKKLIDSGVITVDEARTGYKDDEYTLNIVLSKIPPDNEISPSESTQNQIDSVEVDDTFWDNLANTSQSDIDDIAESVLKV
jgi:hypothetical protein